MENNFKKMSPCPVCKNSGAGLWTQKNSFELYKCNKCNAIFVGGTHDVFKIYSEDYFSGARAGFGYVDYDHDKTPMIKTFNYFLKVIEKFAPMKGRLLDVGAASGFFLKIAEKRGWNVTGVEISDYAASKARERGFRVITGKIEDLRNCGERYSVITMWDVIEHMADPDSALVVAAELLETGGIIAINTPDSGNLVAKALGKNWHLLIPPEHLVIFNQKNLAEMLRKRGFEVLLIDKKGKTFTVQYVFKILANWRRGLVLNNLAKFFATNFIGKIFLPINLRDNFFIVARKI